MSRVAAFEKMLAAGTDNALLRYALGNEFFQNAEFDRAIVHLREAVRHDPGYSAAWKLIGKALTQAGDLAGARDAYTRGIDVAERKGDQQAVKEMRVFLRRLSVPPPHE